MLLINRRDRILSGMLVHGKTNKSVNAVTIYISDCEMSHLITNDSISDTMQLNLFDVVSDVACKTRNVVYLIRCLKCKCVVYVRKTERQVETNERALEEHHVAEREANK